MRKHGGGGSHPFMVVYITVQSTKFEVLVLSLKTNSSYLGKDMFCSGT